MSIQKIAQLAGVSVATVSRVLNHSDTVKAKNRERVLQAIKEEREANLKKKPTEKNERVIEEEVTDEIKPAVDTKDIDIMVED